MEIVFGEETTMQGSTLRTRAIVDGKEVDCKADMEVITELDDLATKAGIPMGKDIAAIANSLRPFFVNGSFDDEDRTSVPLQVHELVSFMRRREVFAATPAMAAGVDNRLWSLEELVEQTSN